MKLDNRGFAISTFMYMLLILAMILILATLAIFSSRKMILDKQKNVAMENSLASSKKICKAVSGVKSLELGTEYECKVNNTDTFNFYVLSLDGTKVNLIMDNNICSDTQDEATTTNQCKYAWNLSTHYNNAGPIEAMTNLYNATKSWDNIPNMQLSELSDEALIENSTYGYKSIKITNGIGVITNKDENSKITIGTTQLPLKARLPRQSEVVNAGCNIYTSNSDYDSCPVWLIKNLIYSNTPKYVINSELSMDSSYGYWILSSQPGSDSNSRYVRYRGYIVDVMVSNAENCGIRPVITVSKSNLYS